MDFGRIIRQNNGISLDEWNAVIEAQECLMHMEARRGRNPATGQEIVFPTQGKACYVEDGERVGNVSLEGGELLTTAVPREICAVIAAELGGKVLEDDRS